MLNSANTGIAEPFLDYFSKKSFLEAKLSSNTFTIIYLTGGKYKCTCNNMWFQTKFLNLNDNCTLL